MILLVQVLASVVVTSNISTLTCPGSDVMLTCMVELSYADGIEVNLNISWAGPIEADIHIITASDRESNSTFIGTALIKSLQTKSSGYYTCLATVTEIASVTTYFQYNTVMLSNETLITTGMYM